MIKLNKCILCPIEYLIYWFFGLMTADLVVVVFFAVVGISNKCACSGFFRKNSRKSSVKPQNLKLIIHFLWFCVVWIASLPIVT